MCHKPHDPEAKQGDPSRCHDLIKGSKGRAPHRWLLQRPPAGSPTRTLKMMHIGLRPEMLHVGP